MLSKVSVGFMTGDPSAGLSSEASCAVVSTLRGIEHAELATWLHHHFAAGYGRLEQRLFSSPHAQSAMNLVRTVRLRNRGTESRREGLGYEKR